MTETTANSNLEPAPARLKIGRNSYGLWYLSATPADPLWDRFDGPAYIRADLYEAKLAEAMKREMKLRRQLAKLEAPMSTSDPLSQSTPYQLGWDDGYAEGYGAKLVDVTEQFMPAGVDHEVEAAARYLMSKRADLSLADAIGLARGMFRAAAAKDSTHG